eukprot:COSAG02_NODE_28161_length_595_cov_0.625000_1_plen_107_part_10
MSFYYVKVPVCSLWSHAQLVWTFMGAVYLDGCESCKVQGLRSIAATTPVESWLVNSTTGAPLHGDFVQRTGNYISGFGNTIADSVFSLDAFNSLSINGSENTIVNSR